METTEIPNKFNYLRLSQSSEYICEAERHIHLKIRADYLVMLFVADAVGLVVHQFWPACAICFNEMKEDVTNAR